MVRVLAVSDVVDEALSADVTRVRDAELILACGDLPFAYLGRLMNRLDVPLVFVPGNHDPDVSGYRVSRGGLTLRAGLPARPPWPDGAINADGRVLDVAGLRIAGLGGSPRYSPGPNQYTGRQQARRGRRLAARAWLRRPRGATRTIDILLTHAPPRGVGDGPDPPHQGFPILNALTGWLRPALLLHGHVDPAPAGRRDHWLDGTIVRNVTGWQLFSVPTRGDDPPEPPDRRSAPSGSKPPRTRGDDPPEPPDRRSAPSGSKPPRLAEAPGNPEHAG